MSDDVVEFFEELGRRGHEPLLAKVTGRVRFDLVDGGRTDRWLVAVDRGDTVVSHQDGRAECTIRVGRGSPAECASTWRKAAVPSDGGWPPTGAIPSGRTRMAGRSARSG